MTTAPTRLLITALGPLAVLAAAASSGRAAPEIVVEVKDPAFKGVALPALKREVIATGIGFSFPVDQPPAVAFRDDSVGRWFEPNCVVGIDKEGRISKLTLYAKTTTLTIDPAEGGKPLAADRLRVEWEAERDKWQAAPENSYRATPLGDKGEKGATVALVPGLFGTGTGRVRVSAPDFKTSKPIPLPHNESFALAPLPRKPDFAKAVEKGLIPKEYAELGDAVRIVPETYPSAVKDEQVQYVIPGYVPVTGIPYDKTKVIHLFQWPDKDEVADADWNWLPEDVFPKLTPGKLRVEVKAMDALSDRTEVLPEAEVAIELDGETLDKADVAGGKDREEVVFDLPKLYVAAIKAGRKSLKKSSVEDVCRDLETKARVVVRLKDPTKRPHYRTVGADEPLAKSANFGLVGAYRDELERYTLVDDFRRPTARVVRTREARKQVSEARAVIGLKPSVVRLELVPTDPKDTYPASPADWKPVVSAKGKDDAWEPLTDKKSVFWDTKDRTLYLILAHEGRPVGTEVRIESEPFESVDSLALTAVDKITVKLKSNAGGLRVLLPPGLDPAAKAWLRVTPEGSADTVSIPLPVEKGEVKLKADDYKLKSFGKAHVELRVSGYKPKVESALGSRTLDGRDLTKADGKLRHVVLVNNWIKVVSANDAIKDNINGLQAEVCKELSRQFKEAKAKQTNFALVGAGEGDWPEARSPFLASEESAPVPKKAVARRDAALTPTELWQRLRQLLGNAEVACTHETIRLVVVTPYQLSLSDAAEGDRKWLLDRAEKCGLRMTFVVLGGPETYTEKLEPNPTVARKYPGLKLVCVDREAVNGEKIEKLPEWLKEHVAKAALED